MIDLYCFPAKNFKQPKISNIGQYCDKSVISGTSFFFKIFDIQLFATAQFLLSASSLEIEVCVKHEKNYVPEIIDLLQFWLI